MPYNKITDRDLTGKGNVGMPDVPMLSAAEMQAKLDELSRDVIIPRFNRLIEELTKNGQPVQSGDILQIRKNEKGDLEISVDGVTWLPAAGYGLSLKADRDKVYTTEEADRKIAEEVTASAENLQKNIDKKADSENVYTKEETDHAIGQAVFNSGVADMRKVIYDKDNNGIVDNSDKLGGQLPEYYGRNTDTIHTYTQSEGVLTGSGENGKFKCVTAGTYTAFTIGGESYSVTSGEETEIELATGVTYSFILDTTDKKINFKSGGGLTGSKLTLSTAAVGDVIKGKTFYSKDKTIKTGTLDLTATATAADVASGKTFFAGNATRKTGTYASKIVKLKEGGHNYPYQNATQTYTYKTTKSYKHIIIFTHSIYDTEHAGDSVHSVTGTGITSVSNFTYAYGYADRGNRFRVWKADNVASGVTFTVKLNCDAGYSILGIE